MTTPPVGIGEVVAGKYVIEHTIGEGGMGVVFAARHGELDRRVAIKFLLPEFAEQGMAAERFRREARAAARMRGEHVCRVLDVGTHQTGVPFRVMEFLEGRDLASELARRGRLPIEEAVSYVLEACEALAEAHAAGIVHRDLKPANLFLETRTDGSRRVKVLDFGVSKSLLELKNGHGTLTRTSSLVGSPLYMSPEQLDSARDVDPRADVWALGVVLFELLTGSTPFHGETIAQLVAAVLMDAPVRMLELPVVLPQPLIEVLQLALAKQREKRYASVAELARGLAPFATPSARLSIDRVCRLLEGRPPSYDTDQPGSGRLSMQPITPVADGKSHGTSGAIAAARAGRRSSTRLWATGIGLLLVVALVSLWVLQNQASTAAAPVVGASIGQGLPGVIADRVAPGPVRAIPAADTREDTKQDAPSDP
ncbi:MAG: serine/threonine-protein kinase, partial [Polyangiales bacterium]